MRWGGAGLDQHTRDSTTDEGSSDTRKPREDVKYFYQ